jgi:hypothetical protein
MAPITNQWIKEAEAAGVPGNVILKDMEELKAKYVKKYEK